MAIVWVHVQMLPIKWTNMFLNLFRRKNRVMATIQRGSGWEYKISFYSL